MTAESATVFVVDDESQVRKALARILRAWGCKFAEFGSAEDFLAAYDAETPGCLILDLSMPGLDGLALQRRLEQAGKPAQIVFLTGCGDIPKSVQAMKSGAIDFLTKPVRDGVLLRAVDEAIEKDRAARQVRAELAEIETKLATLTPREREVLFHVVAGKVNKQIAGELGTVEQTIKVHRARIMTKMGVRSLADLVRMAGRVGIGASQ